MLVNTKNNSFDVIDEKQKAEIYFSSSSESTNDFFPPLNSDLVIWCSDQTEVQQIICYKLQMLQSINSILDSENDLTNQELSVLLETMHHYIYFTSSAIKDIQQQYSQIPSTMSHLISTLQSLQLQVCYCISNILEKTNFSIAFLKLFFTHQFLGEIIILLQGDEQLQFAASKVLQKGYAESSSILYKLFSIQLLELASGHGNVNIVKSILNFLTANCAKGISEKNEKEMLNLYEKCVLPLQKIHITAIDGSLTNCILIFFIVYPCTQSKTLQILSKYWPKYNTSLEFVFMRRLFLLLQHIQPKHFDFIIRGRNKLGFKISNFTINSFNKLIKSTFLNVVSISRT